MEAESTHKSHWVVSDHVKCSNSSYNNWNLDIPSINKKAQLWVRNPCDATAFQIHQEKIERNEHSGIYYGLLNTEFQAVCNRKLRLHTA